MEVRIMPEKSDQNQEKTYKKEEPKFLKVPRKLIELSIDLGKEQKYSPAVEDAVERLIKTLEDEDESLVAPSGSAADFCTCFAGGVNCVCAVPGALVQKPVRKLRLTPRSPES